MKILHLSNIIGEKKGGGVHEVVTNIFKYQKIHRHDPHIWYPGSIEEAKSIGLGKNVQALSTYGPSKYGLIKAILKPIQPEIIQYDIIHQHGIWKPISIYSRKIRNQTGIKAVIQPHGYLAPLALNQSRHIKKFAYQLYEKNNLTAADALIACAYDEAYRLKELFPQKAIAVIPNGISMEFFNSPSNVDLEKKKKRMLFLSQINPLKGLERLFHVIDSIGIDNFKNWELLIVGYGDKKHLNYLKEITHKLGLTKFVQFVGPKHGEEKVKMFDSSDLFILPTYTENYGIVVAEALARRIPVLTTEGAPWRELETSGCGFWVKNDEEGIKNGLVKVLDATESELRGMGARGRKLVEQQYLWSETTLKTIELYRWLLDSTLKPKFVI
jgi:glycosyltransferase involved in cell wall biosynthesis